MYSIHCVYLGWHPKKLPVILMEHFLAYIFIEVVDSYISKGKLFYEQSKVFHSELNYQNNKVFAKTLMHFLSVSRPFSSIHAYSFPS